MKLTGAKREQTIILGVVVLGVVILYVYVTALVNPLWKRFVQLGQEVRSSRTTLQETERVIAQEPSLRQEHQRLSETIEGLGQALPSEEGLPKVIEVLSQVAEETGVRIQTIFPQRSFEGPGESAGKAGGSATKGVADNLKDLYKEIPIQIDALSGFHQLGAFLNQVESDAQAMELKSVRISGNPKDPRAHDVKLVLRVYFSGARAKR